MPTQRSKRDKTELPEPSVFAAGAVVWRRTDDGGVEVLVIHRPRYGDWSLPKGKLDDDETFEQAAVREVREETSIVGTLGADLGEVRYHDHKDRYKLVRWWSLEAASDAVAVGDNVEVDAVDWLTPDRTFERLTYSSDRELLQRFVDAV